MMSVGVGAGFGFPLCQLVSVFRQMVGGDVALLSFLACPGGNFLCLKRAILPEEIASASEDRSRRYPYSLSVASLT